jgi:hypothetical protein
MISSTLSQYQESYKTNLLAFLSEYEDNTKIFFLQNEKKMYQAYQKALVRIKDSLTNHSSMDLDDKVVNSNVVNDLQTLNPIAYNTIVTDLNPIFPVNALSLSALKINKFQIDILALENHIKSSIVILKFIGEQNNIPNDVTKQTYIDELGESVLKQSRNPGLDEKLDKWLKKYEANFEYLPIPLIIEEKPDYITDSYKNYEDRYFNYQIDVCNTILRKVPNEKIINEYKRKFENNIIELRKEIPLPDVTIEKLISDLNNAFFRLEKFMDGSVSTYQSFLFNDCFTMFFNELNKLENVNAKNYSLRDGYYCFSSQLYYAYDKSEFKNQDAYENENFNRDCNELFYITDSRSSEFGINVDLDDYSFEMPSILEIVKNATNESFEQKVNPKTESTNTSTVKNLMLPMSDSFENLINDPLLNPKNNYIVLSENLKLESISKATGSSDNGLFVTYNYEPGFKEWEENQKLEIDKSFINLVKELNHNKVFFFGCSYENFKLNYVNRFLIFLDKFYDASEADFVDLELEFLENILYDIQNSESAHDGYSVSGFDNFRKAYTIISKLGYKQYLFSHNKKIDFLTKHKAYLASNDLSLQGQNNVEKNINIGNQEDTGKELNDVLESTIEDYLEEFKIEINGDGYDVLVNALFEYFSNGKFPVLKSKINFKRINKKRVGWALKDLYKSEKTNNLEIEYFRFAKDNINLFANEVIVDEKFNQSKFYKMFTTNPAK